MTAEPAAKAAAEADADGAAAAAPAEIAEAGPAVDVGGPEQGGGLPQAELRDADPAPAAVSIQPWHALRQGLFSRSAVVRR